MAMELIIFDRANTSSTRLGAKTINVSHHGGLISFSSALAKSIKLKADSRVVFAQRKDNAKSWYFSLVDKDNQNAFKVTEYQTMLLFRSTDLSRRILSSQKEQKSIRFIVSEDSIKVGEQTFYQLIPILKKQNKA